MTDQPLLYTIHIPGTIYTGLQRRDAFSNDNPADLEALQVFKAAKRVKSGGGHRFVLTGERRVLMHILDYVYGLAELIGVGGLSVSTELRTSRTVLTEIANQRPMPVQKSS